MSDICVFILIYLFVILPLGRKISLNFLKREPLGMVTKLFLYFGIGSGLLGLVVLYIGLFGQLYKKTIIIVLGTIAFFLLKESISFIKELFEAMKKFNFRPHLKPIEFIIIGMLVVIWSVSFFGALSPLIGMDAASYHMRDPKIFIEKHSIVHIPYTRDSLWPFLIQMLFTLGLILKGVTVAKLFNFAYGIFTLFGVYSLCRIFFKRKEAILATGIFGSIPAVFTSANYAYTDLAVIFYTVLSFYGFFKWLNSKKNVWFYISAIGCAFLLGIKITSAITPLIIVTFFIINCLRRKAILIKDMVLPLSAFAMIMFIISGVWYIRPWIILGNPIFPFAAYIFGYGYPETCLRYQDTSGIGTGFIQYVTMLWHLTIYPDKFGGESIGPVFLLFLPMVIFLRKFSSFMKYVSAISIILFTTWFVVYQYTRFLYPCLIFLSIIVSYIYIEICAKDKIMSRIGMAMILICLSYSTALAFYHNADNIAVSIGKEAKHDYLARRERTYAIADYINKNIPKDAKISVLNEVRLYYFDRDAAVSTSMKMDLLYNKNIDYKKGLDQYLKDNGYNYLLYAKDDFSSNVPLSGSTTPEDILMDSKKFLIKEMKYDYKDEHFLYQLFRIES